MSTNLAEVRGRRRLTTSALSDRLTELGRPILANGITKIEKGGRRVDTDDLIALAIALDVSPNTLLLPPSAGTAEIALTPHVRVPAAFAWRWATGECALPASELPYSLDEQPDRDARFRRETRPHDPGNYDSLRLVSENPEIFEAARQLMEAAREAQVPLAAIRDYISAREASTAAASMLQATRDLERARAAQARGEFPPPSEEFMTALKARLDAHQPANDRGDGESGEGTDSDDRPE